MNRLKHLGIAIILVTSLASGLLAQGPEKPIPLTRDQAIALALQHNPALREEMGRSAAARATADRARAAERLQLGVSARAATVSEVPEIPPIFTFTPITLGEKSTLITTLGAQQVVYSGGRLSAQTRQAASIANAVATNSERTRQRVALEAERAFWLLYAAQRDREVAEQALTTAEAHLAIAQARFEARAVPQFDVLRAEVQVQESRQTMMQTTSNIAVTQAALLRALGLPAGEFATADGNASIPETAMPLEPLLAQATASRPELLAYDWQIKAADAAIVAARGERKPTVALAASYQSVTPESLMQTSQWTLAATASLPVLDGGAAQAKVREAEAQRAQLLAQRESARNAIAMEVRQAHARVLSAGSQIAVAQKRVAESEELLRIANVRYEGGVGTPTEVADAQTILTRARQGLLRANTDWAMALADLRYATGSPVPVNTAAIEEAHR